MRHITLKTLFSRSLQGLAWVLCWLPLQAEAVSLGDELILSRLGDPVEVEIGIMQWDELNLDQVQIGAGTETEYRNFGLQWQSVLASLRFNLVGPNRDGQVRVLISSREPLNEPYLELLVVMRWPGGSLLREYVLLFDPPESLAPGLVTQALPAPAVSNIAPGAAPDAPRQPRESAVANVNLPLPQPAEIPDTQEPSRQEAAPDAPDRPAVDAAESPAPQRFDNGAETPDYRTTVAVEVQMIGTRRAPRPGEGQTGRRSREVLENDSLWAIARQEVPRGEEADWFQYMLALFSLNPDAFLNNNIALLKQAEALQLPSGADLAKVSRESAKTRFEQRWNTDSFTFTPAVELPPEPVVADIPQPVTPPPTTGDAALQSVDDSEAPMPLLLPDANTVIVAVANPPTEQPLAPPATRQSISIAPASPVSDSNAEPLINAQTASFPDSEPQAPLVASEAEAGSEMPAASAAVSLEETADDALTGTVLPVEPENAPASLDEDSPVVFTPVIASLDLGSVIESKQQRMRELEGLVVVMRTHVQNAEDVAARLKTALELKRKQQSSMFANPLLNAVALVLLLALVVATVMLLRMNAQYNTMFAPGRELSRHAVFRKRRQPSSSPPL